MQTIIPLGGNGAVRLTTARYYTPAGRSIQAKGIDPNQEVLQDIPDELKGKDETEGRSRSARPSQGRRQGRRAAPRPISAGSRAKDKQLLAAYDFLRGVRQGARGNTTKPASRTERRPSQLILHAAPVWRGGLPGSGPCLRHKGDVFVDAASSDLSSPLGMNRREPRPWRTKVLVGRGLGAACLLAIMASRSTSPSSTTPARRRAACPRVPIEVARLRRRAAPRSRRIRRVAAGRRRALNRRRAPRRRRWRRNRGRGGAALEGGGARFRHHPGAGAPAANCNRRPTSGSSSGAA